MIRSYRELSRLETFEERYQYLRLDGDVGALTFGNERLYNQRFYRSREWKLARSHVIARDLGCDLGIDDREIYSRVIIHHMNPMTPTSVARGGEELFDPAYLISTTHDTHNAIHYGDERLLVRAPIERLPGDTKLW